MFGDIAGVHGCTQGLQAAATLQVHLRPKGIGRRGGGGGVGAVARDDGVGLPAVVQGPAVGHQQAVEVPFVAQDVHQQLAVGAAGAAVEAVVAAHHLLHVAVAHDVLEGGQVGGPQVAGTHAGVELVPHPFGTAVHGQVLDAGRRRQWLGVVGLGVPLAVRHIAVLQSADACQPHGGGEEGVLAVGLHAAAPAGVAEEVDVGGEEGQPRVVGGFAQGHAGVAAAGLDILDVGLDGHLGEDVEHHGGVEGGCQGHGSGPHGGVAVAAHAVEGLVPPAVGRQAQRGDGGVAVLHQGEFLVQGQAAQQVLHPLVHSERGVLKGKVLCAKWGATQDYCC